MIGRFSCRRRCTAALAVWQAFWPAWFVVSEGRADAIVGSAQEGQDLGMQLLGGAARLPSVDTSNPTATTHTEAGRFNVREFMPGSGLESTSELESASGNPASLVDRGAQAWRDAAESGCRTTRFHYKETGEVLRITALKRTLVQRFDAAGQPVLDALGGPVYDQVDEQMTVDGAVSVAYPTVGVARTFEVVVQVPTPTVPGYILRYQASPFAVPRDGTYFTYNHRVAGAAATVSSYGTLDDGWTTGAAVSAAGATAVTVQADLYRAQRTYSDPGGAPCPPDPPGCALDGVNLCGPPGAGVAELFDAGRHSHLADGYQATRAAARNPKPPASDADVAPVLDRSTPIVTGADPIFSEVFTGCAEQVSFGGTTTRTAHIEDILTCENARVGVATQGCDGSRTTRFQFVERRNVIRLSAAWAARDCPLEGINAYNQCVPPCGGDAACIASCEDQRLATEADCNAWNAANAGQPYSLGGRAVPLQYPGPRRTGEGLRRVDRPGPEGRGAHQDHPGERCCRGDGEIRVQGDRRGIGNDHDRGRPGDGAGDHGRGVQPTQAGGRAGALRFRQERPAGAGADPVPGGCSRPGGRLLAERARHLQLRRHGLPRLPDAADPAPHRVPLYRGRAKARIDRKVGNCSYVGDYCATDSIIGCIETRDSFCCYKTPLARIISERLRRQGVGGGYGGAKHPNCGGFSAAELASANWSRIDLSEWEARLAQAGILPATPEQAEARWGMGASRAALATGQTAQGPDREISKPAYVEERLGVRSGAITEGRETLAGQQVCYSDPELMPWYEDQTSPPAPPSCRSLAADLYFGAYMTSLTTIRFDLKTGTWQPSTPTDAAAYDVRVPVVDAGQACQPSAAFGWTAAQWQGANVPGKFDASACYHLLQPPTCENGLVGIAQIQDNCSSGDNLLKYGAQYTFQYEVCQAGGGAGGPGECFAPVP